MKITELYLELGVDLSAFQEVTVPYTGDAIPTSEELLAMAKPFFENSNFEVDFESGRGLRIVNVKNQDDEPLDVGRVYAEPNYPDAGYALTFFLDNSLGIDELIERLQEHKVIPDLGRSTYAATLKLPAAEPLSVEFSARTGASESEKDLAFMQALAALGTIEYKASPVQVAQQ